MKPLLIGELDMTTYDERQRIFERIQEKFGEIAYQVKIKNNQGNASAAVNCEPLVCRLLNIIFDWELKSANIQRANEPVIDLYDDPEHRVCVQVTSELSMAKLRATVNCYLTKHIDEKYDRLIIFFVGNYKPRGHLDPRLANVINLDEDVLDVNSTLRIIKGWLGDDSDKKLLDVYNVLVEPDRFINFEKEFARIDSEKGLVQRDDQKRSIAELIQSSLSRYTFILGKHGMGKTTYLLQLAKRETIAASTNRFKHFIWVPYTDSDGLEGSINAALKDTGLRIRDINNSSCILLIDRAPLKIVSELSTKDKYGKDVYHFYCIVTSSVWEMDPPEHILLSENQSLAKAIFLKSLSPIISDAGNYVETLAEISQGHPLVAKTLSRQAVNYIKGGKPLKCFLNDLQEEGFAMNVGDEESVIMNLAKRFSEDYKSLTPDEQSILKCFSILSTSNDKIDPLKINWKSSLSPFIKLSDYGFLDKDADNAFGMHDLICDVVRQLCGSIEYEDVQDLVKALSIYIDRNNLHGADMVSVYHEVYHAFALFTFFSGKDYAERQSLYAAEKNPEYAWMTTNIFSAFDDYYDSRAYEGSKFAVRLCEYANKESKLSDYPLAQAYNCLAYLPSMFAHKTPEEVLRLTASNLENLNRACSIYERVKATGEEHPAFEAKLFSNRGAIWQRLYRLEPAKKANAAYKEALELRKSEYLKTSDSDPLKDEKLLDYAHSIFLSATDCYFSHQYDDAINYHKESIAMYEQSPSTTPFRLFIGYSRLAGTYQEKAKGTHKVQDLIDAYYSYQSAYKYLMQQPQTVRDGADDFWKKFLEISLDIKGCNLDFVNLNPSSEALLNELASATDTSREDLARKYSNYKSTIEYN